MVRLVKVIAVAVLLLAVSNVALAEPGFRHSGAPVSSGPVSGNPGSQHSVPEMSPSSMGSALGLIGAGTVLLLGRRRKIA